MPDSTCNLLLIGLQRGELTLKSDDLSNQCGDCVIGRRYSYSIYVRVTMVGCKEPYGRARNTILLPILLYFWALTLLRVHDSMVDNTKVTSHCF